MKSRRRTQNLKGSTLAKIERIVRLYPTDKAVQFNRIRRAEFESFQRRDAQARGFAA